MEPISPHSGALDLARPVWHHLHPSTPATAGELFQTSLMSALLSGVYEGTMTYGELHRHGDFGLGTFNDLDGEMVGIDGAFYQLRSDGSARPVQDGQKTPFAVVTFFRPDRQLDITSPLSKPELESYIAQATDANLFAAVKVTGIFDEIRTRTVQQQQRPFPPLTQAAAHQAIRTFQNSAGVLAGFRTPAYAQGIGVAGFHLHFLTSDRQGGGHALDYVVRSGTVEVATLHDFHVELPQSEDFVKATLTGGDIDAGIKSSEG
jgi:acetolactate decarboxylase